MKRILAFTTDGNPYYVLGKKVSGETSSPSEPGNSPQTGAAPICGCGALMLVAATGLTAAQGYRIKRKRNN